MNDEHEEKKLPCSECNRFFVCLTILILLIDTYYDQWQKVLDGQAAKRPCKESHVPKGFTLFKF